MKLTVWINSQGQACWHPSWPVEPDYFAHKYFIHDPISPIPIKGLFEKDMIAYRSALESAKREAVPFEDQDWVNECIEEQWLKPDTFYTTDDRFKGTVEVFYYLPWSSKWVTTRDCIFNKSEATKKVARLIPAKQEEPKETLTRDSMMNEWGNDTDGSDPFDWLLKNFTITRK